MSVVIVGGGVAGLTLALMLHRRGIAATVYEQASEIRELGVGINTLPHAIKELAALGLMPALDAVAIRTQELIYVNRLGQKVWQEKRGLDAGFDYPQFSIHRGRLQKVIHDAVVKEMGPQAVRTGLKLAGFLQDEGGVTAHFVDARSGASSQTVRGEILVGADGIHSSVRRKLYPGEGRPQWQGAILYRGATDWPQFLTGRAMYIAGGMGLKLSLYPIAPGAEAGKRLTNWAIVAKVADGEATPPPANSWSRTARPDDYLPYARRFVVPGVDVAALVGATTTAWEYPMCDRDPLPAWSFGRATLMGDAAHPMYPVGSNGAAQAILDARALADALKTAETPMRALYDYEEERLAKTSEIVRLNRKGGPERVIDEVEKRAPAGFNHVDEVLGHAEREAIVKGYAGKAGFALAQVNK